MTSRSLVVCAVAASLGWMCGPDERVGADGGGRVGPGDDPAAGLWFSDVAARAGIEYAQADADTCVLAPLLQEVGECYLERWSGGAAVGDVDGDGRDDLYVTTLTTDDRLFRNRGDGTFEDWTARSGITVGAPTNGAAFVDIDNDGDLDLYVTTFGGPSHHLFVNDGGGRFVDEALARGAGVFGDGLHFGTSIATGDLDGDGFADLYVGHQVPPVESSFVRPAVPGQLLVNRGLAAPGHFVAADGLVPLAVLEAPAFAPSLVDLDLDGAVDLQVVANDGTSALLWNDGFGGLVERTAESGTGTSSAEMGSTFGDIDGDGDLDWFVSGTSCPMEACRSTLEIEYDSASRLYLNNGDRTFSDATIEAGLRWAYLAWGTALFDADNDGDLDIVLTNGWLTADRLVNEPDYYAHDPMRFWRNDGGFPLVESSAAVGMVDERPGQGLLIFDFDADGRLDVLVVNAGGGPSLYRNETVGENDWLRVRCGGESRAFEGLGAIVRVWADDGSRPQVRVIGAATHYLGQSERVAHFGLGPRGGAPVARVELTWPRTGHVDVYEDVPSNQLFVALAPPDELVTPPRARPAQPQ